MGFIKAIAVKGMHKEVHRAAFQSMQRQQGELCQAYVAKLKVKAAVLQGRDSGDPASGRGVQQGAPGEAVVRDSQLALAGGQAVRRMLDKLDSSSTKLSGQIQSTAGMKVVEPRKGSTCHRVHKKCTKCQRVHPCTIECHNCKKAGHVSQR